MMEMMIMQSRLSLIGVCALVVLGACSSKPDAKAAPPRGSAADTAARDSSSGDVNAAKSEGANTTKVSADTNVRPKLIGGRKGPDSMAFKSAIRAGLRAEPNWPKGPAAAAGALLPGKRIIAYYGNPHSKKMGVLGEYPEQQMLSMLDKTLAAWRAADPSTPVVPA